MKFYTRFTLPQGHSDLGSISCPEPTLTVQADRDQCDINEIVRRFGVTGMLPYGVQVPVYADFADVPNDYHAAVNYMMAADDAFMEMPAAVRTRFDNDAGKFLDFVRDSSNREEAERLGLVLPSPSVVEQASPANKTEASSPEGATVAQSPT